MLQGTFGNYSETYVSSKHSGNLTAEDLAEIAFQGEMAESLGYLPGVEIEYDYYGTKSCTGVIKEINTTSVSFYTSKNIRVLRVLRKNPPSTYHQNSIDIISVDDVKKIITSEQKLPLVVSHATARVVENEHSLQLVSEALEEAKGRNIQPGVRVKFVNIKNGIPVLSNGIVVEVLEKFQDIVFIQNLHPAIVKIKYMTFDWQDTGVEGVYAYKPVNGTYSPNATLINGVVQDHD